MEKDFGLWLWSVIVVHWPSLVTGGFLMAMIAWWNAHNPVNPIKAKWVVRLFAIFLFWACFLAWREEHRKVQEQQISLSGEIINAVFGQFVPSSPDGSTWASISFLVDVTNTGNRQSGIRHWSCQLLLPNNPNGYECRLVDTRPDESVKFPGDLVDFSREDDLNIKGREPLPSGKTVHGFVRFSVPGVHLMAITAASTWKLSFQDVIGSNHTCSGFTTYDIKTLVPIK